MIFSVFADFHYKKRMNAVTIAHMEEILESAHKNQVDFIIHVGDFCNDYIGSPELLNTYINNKYNIPAYGIYGNHELESNDNSMEVVTPFLTNSKDVIWGTSDGKIGDGSVGYYYFEKEQYRIICLDSNYSYNDELDLWEHNRTASWGAPAGNKNHHSLGPKQLEWLENVLLDAAQRQKSCIIFGHASFSGMWYPSHEAKITQKIIREVNDISPRTVIMCINGHYHTNHLEMKDNVVYFDVNAVINGSWMPKQHHHYNDEHLFKLDNYDNNGCKTGSSVISMKDLWQGINTHYFASPLSAIVQIADDAIEIRGNKTTWCYDVIPNNPNPACMPEISSERFILK